MYCTWSCILVSFIIVRRVKLWFLHWSQSPVLPVFVLNRFYLFVLQFVVITNRSGLCNRFSETLIPYFSNLRLDTIMNKITDSVSCNPVWVYCFSQLKSVMGGAGNIHKILYRRWRILLVDIGHCFQAFPSADNRLVCCKFCQNWLKSLVTKCFSLTYCAFYRT